MPETTHANVKAEDEAYMAMEEKKRKIFDALENSAKRSEGLDYNATAKLENEIYTLYCEYVPDGQRLAPDARLPEGTVLPPDIEESHIRALFDLLISIRSDKEARAGQTKY